MKFSSLLVVFTGLLLTVVSAARYEAILNFRPTPPIYPQPYFTVIELPDIGKSLRVNLWQTRNPQTLTEAYGDKQSKGYVEVDDISAFNGRYAGLVNDNTEYLHLRIQGDGQLFTFIGQSATKRPVTNMKVRADVRPLVEDDLFSWW